MIRRAANLMKSLRRDQRGTVMVEFAIAAPVLLLLYLGSFVMSDMITCNRKVTVTARTITDLATRYPSLTEADAQNILNASTQVLAPYPSSNATIIMSEVKVTDATHATVVWSRSLNGVAQNTNLSVTIPANMAAVNTYMILSKVSYTYTPTTPFLQIGSMVLSDTILMLPRVSDQVPISP